MKLRGPKFCGGQQLIKAGIDPLRDLLQGFPEFERGLHDHVRRLPGSDRRFRSDHASVNFFIVISLRPLRLLEWKVPPEDQAEYLAQLRVEIRRGEDRSPFVAYARVAAAFAQFRREGMLVPTDDAAIWQAEDGTVIGLASVEALSEPADVRPADRESVLRWLESTRVVHHPLDFRSGSVADADRAWLSAVHEFRRRLRRRKPEHGEDFVPIRMTLDPNAGIPVELVRTMKGQDSPANRPEQGDAMWSYADI